MAIISPAEKHQSAVELHKKITKITQDIALKEKILSSAEKMLVLTVGNSNHKAVEADVVNQQDQLQLLRGELQLLKQQQELLGPVEIIVDAATVCTKDNWSNP